MINFKWIILILAFALSGCTLADSRRSVTFAVPAGYVGWIRVKYNISGTPPLPIVKGKYMARIPANGLLTTSTIEGEGWGADAFFYSDKTGKLSALSFDPTKPNSMVWAPAGRTNETWMFIGTKQQWSDAQRLIGGYDPGPLKLPITAQSEQKKQ